MRSIPDTSSNTCAVHALRRRFDRLSYFLTWSLITHAFLVFYAHYVPPRNLVIELERPERNDSCCVSLLVLDEEEWDEPEPEQDEFEDPSILIRHFATSSTDAGRCSIDRIQRVIERAKVKMRADLATCQEAYPVYEEFDEPLVIEVTYSHFGSVVSTRDIHSHDAHPRATRLTSCIRDVLERAPIAKATFCNMTTVKYTFEIPTSLKPPKRTSNESFELSEHIVVEDGPMQIVGLP